MKKNMSILSQGASGFTNDYVRYVRPSLGKLLRGMSLDVEYIDGEGDHLEMIIAGQSRQVIDLTGGYGANLIGHKNKAVLKEACQALSSGPPSNVQGSLRKSTVKLAIELSKRLEGETKDKNWISHFSNSGTEAVEAALKHSMYHYTLRLTKLSQKVVENKNSLITKLQGDLLTPSEKECLKTSLITFNEMLHPKLNLNEFDDNLMLYIEALYSSYLNQIKNLEPQFASLAGGFHGKTLGSLEVMGHPSHLLKLKGLKKGVLFGEGVTNIEEGFKHTCIELPFIDLKTYEIKPTRFSKLSSFILEPVQGEGGIRPLAKEDVQKIHHLCKRYQVQVIADDIQAGLYRTGKFTSLSHYDTKADIYLFSKGLGGGFAKIAVTMINAKSYVEVFGVKHTSTFSEDHYSSSVALAVLNELQDDQIKLSMETAEYFISELQTLKGKYPDLITEIRGKGLMIGIDLNLSGFRDISSDTQIFHEQDQLAYFITSALLHKEGIRVAPSLSNPSTLRIEPSIYLKKETVVESLAGLERLLLASRKRDIEYFFEKKVELSETVSRSTFALPKEKLESIDVAFLCHLIDADHCKQLMQSMSEKVDSEILHNIYDFTDIQTYIPVCNGKLTGINGKQINYSFLSIPYTTDEFVKAMAQGKRDRVVEKIQNAVKLAKSLGASTVGLGQFNSIVTNNGLSLNSLGMNMTTGNAFTVHLTVETIKEKLREHSLGPNEVSMCCVGAGGNIMAMVSRSLVNHCASITLVNRTPIESSKSFRQTAIEVLKAIAQSSNFQFHDLKTVLQTYGEINQNNILEILNNEIIMRKVKTTSDLMAANESNVVICGTSSSVPIIGSEHISPDTLLVDLSVPSNIKESAYTTAGVKVVHAGHAKLPEHSGEIQYIDTPAFPLVKGESFACMAETFALGLSDHKRLVHIGEINAKMVETSAKIAKDCGISLGSIKEIAEPTKYKKAS